MRSSLSIMHGTDKSELTKDSDHLFGRGTSGYADDQVKSHIGTLTLRSRSVTNLRP
jgi:hypothetical protein